MSDSGAIAIGFAIKRLRSSKKLSQESLAEMSGIHRTYISSIERGERNVGINMLLSILDALEQKPSSFFRELEDEGVF
ncbi:helix-turn-helix domain-containing protein [Deinococcus radiophilus]|uniref:XRE family transcriptional regulator n=1 Tax=Deinococcus radiophilus TaxID=32062 RepID=A0A3S0JNK7_9DEIO|nr:helix-turn-helix transcriptional regulator [Deinococcus radiophilus]RTR25716.1 XRE family transcriptional regulator [Deinococcus radiophilus]UFA50211.1 helix-turn-helix domain-containing protein [Deinococcus radiophilus]